MSDQYIFFIVTTIVLVVIALFRVQAERRYKEFKKVEEMAQQNREKFLQNKLQDEADQKAFDTYKETMAEKNAEFMVILREIKQELLDLIKETVLLKTEVANLKKGE